VVVRVNEPFILVYIQVPSCIVKIFCTRIPVSAVEGGEQQGVEYKRRGWLGANSC